jgi:hypothetical protein
VRTKLNFNRLKDPEETFICYVKQKATGRKRWAKFHCLMFHAPPPTSINEEKLTKKNVFHFSAAKRPLGLYPFFCLPSELMGKQTTFRGTRPWPSTS